MLEKDIENLIAQHPEEFFPGQGLTLVAQQKVVERRRLDILFLDQHRRQVVVEVKRGILSREASGQIAEYYGLLKNAHPESIVELILCANIIPRERKTFLETIGIECLELGLLRILEVAKKYDYRFLDDGDLAGHLDQAVTELARKDSPEPKPSETVEEPVSVWIFQGNPQRYDILNALSDPDIGHEIHWTVNQHKLKIRQGHLVLLWMSGPEAGIYALARVECDPGLMPEPVAESRYWLQEEPPTIRNRVRLTILRKFLNRPILRRDLVRIPNLSNLSILRQCQGTNFPVRNAQWQMISRMM